MKSSAFSKAGRATRKTLLTLRRRWREDRLALTAGSLTFTTLTALVPLLTVMLAVFSAFPIFAEFQNSLQTYFLQSLVPARIAKPVLEALTQFASKASQLGAAGLAVLLLTALALMLTIDRTLNGIWRIETPRPIAQRLLVYWAVLTLGPLVLGVSLSLTSYAISASRGLVAVLPGGVTLLLGGFEFALLALGLAGLFHQVPNTRVRWRHAGAGGLFATVGFELGKWGLGWYLGRVPTYSVVYGAFATVPILLLWIYLGWIIVLLGAVIAAHAPDLALDVTRWHDSPGSDFRLAVAVLRELAAARATNVGGIECGRLAAALHADPRQIDSAFATLAALNWAGRLDEPGTGRWVLLCDPAVTPAAPLLARLLIEPSVEMRRFWQRAGFDALMLSELWDEPDGRTVPLRAGDVGPLDGL